MSPAAAPPSHRQHFPKKPSEPTPAPVQHPQTSRAPNLWQLWQQSPSQGRQAGSEEGQGADTALSVGCGAAVGAPRPWPLGGRTPGLDSRQYRG